LVSDELIAALAARTTLEDISCSDATLRDRMAAFVDALPAVQHLQFRDCIYGENFLPDLTRLLTTRADGLLSLRCLHTSGGAFA